MTDETLFPNFGHITIPAPDWAANRPVRIVMMGDFSAGAPAGRLETGDDLASRKLLSVDFDNFEDVLARLDVRLAVPLGNEGGVELEFSNDLDDFHPDELYDNVEVFSELYSLSGRLNNSSTASEVLSWADDGNKPVSRIGRHRSRSGAPPADAKLSDLAKLVGKATEVDTDADVDDLVRAIVGPLVKAADSPNVSSLTESVDEALSDAMRAEFIRLKCPGHAKAADLLFSLRPWPCASLPICPCATPPKSWESTIPVSGGSFIITSAKLTRKAIGASLNVLRSMKPVRRKPINFFIATVFSNLTLLFD